MEVGGIILAGGQSSRMGQEKGLVPFRGKPMVQWVLDAAKTVCEDVILVANDSRYERFDIPVVPDVVTGQGPLAGIITGLRNSRHEYNLVLSCDIPLVHPELLQFLIENRQDLAVTLSESGARWNPLIAIYCRSVLPRFENSLATGHLRLTDAISSVPHHVLNLQTMMPGFNASWLNNFNSLEELQAHENQRSNY